MPIPATSILCVEAQMAGAASAAGSSVKKFLFTFHYRRTSTVNPFTKASFDAAFQAAVPVVVGTALNVRYLQSGNNIRIVDDALDSPQLFNHAVAGAILTDSMPVSASAFLLFRTGIRGKSYRGSKHLGPMSETDTTLATEDLFNAAALIRLGNVAAACLANIVDSNGNTWVPCVLSRKLSQLSTNPTTVVRNDVVSVSVNRRVGWMRHRKVASVY